MEHITLFTDILPEEQERMRICFHAREMTFRNGETIMEYSSSMKKIGLILYGRAVLYCCDSEGNQDMIDELKKDAVFGEAFLLPTDCPVRPDQRFHALVLPLSLFLYHPHLCLSLEVVSSESL
mgnify:CR=1 FL=1